MKRELATVAIILIVVAVGFKFSNVPEKAPDKAIDSSKNSISREAPPNTYASTRLAPLGKVGGNPNRNRPTVSVGPNASTSLKRNAYFANKAVNHIQDPSRAARRETRRAVGGTQFRAAVDRALKMK